MAILNYSTSIDSVKTIGEISSFLVGRKANKISVDYKDGVAIALTFCIPTKKHGILFYELPCNWEGVLAVMKMEKVGKKYENKDQALRTGWRIIKVWVEAQMAIVDAGLVDMEEIFLPYVIMKEGVPLYKSIGNRENTIFLKN